MSSTIVSFDLHQEQYYKAEYELLAAEHERLLRNISNMGYELSCHAFDINAIAELLDEVRVDEAPMSQGLDGKLKVVILALRQIHDLLESDSNILFSEGK